MQHSLKEMAAVASMMYDQGKSQEVFDICCVALIDKGADHIFKLLLAQVASKVSIVAFNPVIKSALFQSIVAEGIDVQKMAVPWINMLWQDRTFDLFFSFKDRDYAYAQQDWKNFESCLQEPFFIEGLKTLIIIDDQIEVCLRNIRKILLMNLLDEGVLKTKYLEFICALAEQCYNNEYVYFVTEEERQKLASLPLTDPISIAVFACYESLMGKEFHHKISAVSAFKRLVQVQVKEPEQEQDLKPSIRVLSEIEDDVSVKVRGMYEKNPYPRWRSLDVPLAQQPDITGDVLIAGCGTGRYIIQTKLVLPSINIQAVDISLSSIAYGMRMAEHYGAKNINFAQCDILELDKLEQTFDFINCSGVLHHMADPVAGWKSILKRLNAGGRMVIGLYSTKARKVIFDGREEIQKAGYGSDDEGIRAFRDYVFSLPADDGRFQRLKTFKDFYSLSEARDLLFHVQEATYTIPQLQEIFEELGLEFIRFRVPHPRIGEMYKEKFPDDPDMKNLDHWNALENEIPEMFGEMYNFLCKRKNDTVANIAADRLIQTGIFL